MQRHGSKTNILHHNAMTQHVVFVIPCVHTKCIIQHVGTDKNTRMIIPGWANNFVGFCRGALTRLKRKNASPLLAYKMWKLQNVWISLWYISTCKLGWCILYRVPSRKPINYLLKSIIKAFWNTTISKHNKTTCHAAAICSLQLVLSLMSLLWKLRDGPSWSPYSSAIPHQWWTIMQNHETSKPTSKDKIW